MGLLTGIYRWGRYAKARILESKWSDFVDMGMGIEARYERCARWWAPHLVATKQFTERNLTCAHSLSRIHVFGAGRLLDVDCEYLHGVAGQVALYDADRGAVGFWPLKSGFTHMVTDLSGVMNQWTESVASFVREESPSIETLSRFLRALPAPNNECIAIANEDGVLSLNVLSQLPLYWRDRVERILANAWGFRPDARGDFDGDIQNALDSNYRILQTHHLSLCARAKKAVIVTDDFFGYYRRDIAPWQIEPALYVDVDGIRGMVCDDSDTWLWHIAPQGIESNEHGEIHRVIARAFSRNII